MAVSGVILRALARVLPSEFRERVFEPALADLRLEEARSAAPLLWRWFSRAIFVGECLRLGVPQLVWRRGRPTRIAGALLAAIVLASLVIQRINYGAGAGAP
jgi:hypothetical protein